MSFKMGNEPSQSPYDAEQLDVRARRTSMVKPHHVGIMHVSLEISMLCDAMFVIIVINPNNDTSPP